MRRGCASRFAAMPADWLEVIDIEVGILPNRRRKQQCVQYGTDTVIA